MSKRIKYKKGQKLGQLIFIKDYPDKISESGKVTRIAIFECQYCKKHFKAAIGNVKTINHTTSCGCESGNLVSKKLSTHKMTHTPLYFAWHDLKNRCNNNKYPEFHRYGGRGIGVCEEWSLSFISFYEWAMSNGWEKGLQIDRYDNDGDYEPSNCRCVTSKVNNRNRSNNVMTMDKSIRLRRIKNNYPSISDIELGKIFNISRTTAYDVRTFKTWN